jgi:hypothetical protein
VEYINTSEKIVKHCHLTLEQINDINEMGLLGHSIPQQESSRLSCKIWRGLQIKRRA